MALVQSLCYLSRFCCEVRIFFGCTGLGERYAQHYMMFTTTTVELGNPLLSLTMLCPSITDTSSAIPTTRVRRVEEEKEYSNVSQSMSYGSLLYLISIHKEFDFMRMNLIICIGMYALGHNMHIHLIICICVFEFAYAFLNSHMHFCICICIFVFAYALLCAYA